jgi:sarcosine/dimethylglycine N-methyltransferase
MSTQYSEPVTVAQNYYNSSDADNFYYGIWGGEDIHIGLYQSDEEPIARASRRTVERMASRLSQLNEHSRAIDVGAGYGGSARYLAETRGCRVVALNLSEVENQRDRAKNAERGLAKLIDVVDGDFEHIPYNDDAFDVAWSQDAMLHSGNREKVLAEVARVLKAGGEFIFTDPMMADDCPQGVLQPILDRLHLETLGSPAFYRRALAELGFDELAFEEHTGQLATHYARVLAETEAREAELAEHVSDEYLTRMKTGLQHWVNGGRNGHLTWGIFHFKKRG